MEYKVLTTEDRRWTGKFSPENLGAHAQQLCGRGLAGRQQLPGGEYLVHQHLADHDSP
jgi:hypothetical protein